MANDEKAAKAAKAKLVAEHDAKVAKWNKEKAAERQAEQAQKKGTLEDRRKRQAAMAAKHKS